MKRSPDQIIACPKCGGLARYQVTTSVNTAGLQIWTDARQRAPMMPQPPGIVMCAHCARAYWLEDAAEIGSIYLSDDPQKTAGCDPAWASAAVATEPTPEQYAEAIQSGLAEDETQERNLRILAWWRANDDARDLPESARVAFALSETARRNLERLIELLTDDDDSDVLMRAEALRELGQFDAAIETLHSATEPHLTPVVNLLRALCEKQDSVVKEAG